MCQSNSTLYFDSFSIWLNKKASCHNFCIWAIQSLQSFVNVEKGYLSLPIQIKHLESSDGG